MIDVDQVRKTTPEELRKYCLFDIDGDRGYAIHIDVVAELLTRERIGHVAKFAQIHQDFIDLLKHLHTCPNIATLQACLDSTIEKLEEAKP